MEGLVSKITTVVLLGAFSVFAALTLSDSLVTNKIVTDKNLATLLVFFGALVLSIIVVVAVFKAVPKKDNGIKLKGSSNKLNQDFGTEKEPKNKNNLIDIEGDDNIANQDIR
ncbi:hypothetical protein [Flectobacillus sp. BAB-3569]|uniref:hypothetical protein n=1 Tax=Flectobacillus sp. BAB-3569 TaxID=1509483 RepID=UPI000BA3CDBC|nr:hypothetical protein [Flectobacillus sp. BAB-3569]PAC26984.1 hypothetical protein BWI92_23985 [Flectobacillus sp. BAB-3569]